MVLMTPSPSSAISASRTGSLLMPSRWAIASWSTLGPRFISPANTQRGSSLAACCFKPAAIAGVADPASEGCSIITDLVRAEAPTGSIDTATLRGARTAARANIILSSRYDHICPFLQRSLPREQGLLTIIPSRMIFYRDDHADAGVSCQR